MFSVILHDGFLSRQYDNCLNVEVTKEGIKIICDNGEYLETDYTIKSIKSQ